MEKKYLLFILFLILSIYKCDEEYEEYYEEEEEELFDDSYDDTIEFKKTLKEYLINNKLLDSDKLIERKEMEKIFLDVILTKDMNSIPDYLKEIIDELKKYFVDKYYKQKNNEIRGKDIYELIDILDVSRKLDQLTSGYDYNDYEEENIKKETSL